MLDQPDNPASSDSEVLQALTEALVLVQHQNTVLQEGYSRLEFELQQAGWSREASEGTQEPTIEALRQAAEMARFGYLKNPLPRRGVDLQASYVFAQGFNVKANDEDTGMVLKDFMDDSQNQRVLFAADMLAQRERELALDGELFIAFFPNRSSGKVKISCISTGQVTSVITDPENSARPWFYLREWMQDGFSLDSGPLGPVQQQAYHPDIGFQPKRKPASIAGIQVKWDTPVLHVKVGGFSDWKRGFPETEVSRPYATATKDFLGDWASYMKSLRRFAWAYRGSKGAQETAAIKASTGTTIGNLSPGLSSGFGVEQNPAPLTASMAIVPDGRSLDPISTRNSAPSADEVRQLRVMAIAASGFGDHFYGDAQQGALATAQSLDRPTELRIRGRQSLWASVFRQVFSVVLFWAVRAPSGVLRQKGRVSPRDEDDPDAMLRVIWKKAVDSTINIDWPRIVEPDLLSYVQAMTLASPHLPTELVTQLLMVVLEVDGLDQWIDRWKIEVAEAKAAAAAAALQAAGLPGAKVATAPVMDAKSKLMRDLSQTMTDESS